MRREVGVKLTLENLLVRAPLLAFYKYTNKAALWFLRQHKPYKTLIKASRSHYSDHTQLYNRSLRIKNRLAGGIGMAILVGAVLQQSPVMPIAAQFNNNSDETQSTHGIQKHVVGNDQDIETIAKAYGISSDTIRQTNDIGEDEEPSGGTVLEILPIDGYRYTAREGDSVDSVSVKFNAASDEILFANGHRAVDIQPGQILIIQNVKPTEVDAPDTVANSQESKARESNTTREQHAPAPAARQAAYDGNRYDYGHCTWHVYNLRAQAGRPIPSYWGNATSWGYNAGRDGFTVNDTPKVGAIAWQRGYYGHVAYVTAVENGRVHVKEMFGFGGNGIPVENIYSASAFDGYIH